MNIAVFYHCLLSSKNRAIEEDYALNLVMEQMSALAVSGLAEAANNLFIHVNGTPEETTMVASVCHDRAKVVGNGQCNTEIPTLIDLHEWAYEHPGYAILYHHTKGVSTPRQADNWRLRMETFTVWNWPDCVERLKQGYEAVGCHWLTPESNPGSVSSPFFGGNFWWARSEYIKRLPLLPEDTWDNRYQAESWIGRGNPRPRVYDYSPGWPTL